jgi:hypothetical protein
MSNDKKPYNNPTARERQSSIFAKGCLIQVGLAGQVGVKSSCARWRGGVS